MSEDTKYAVLRKKKKSFLESSKNPGLELLVGAVSPKILDMKGKILGEIKFESSLSPEEILKDFQRKQPFAISHNIEEKSLSMLRYPYSFEPTITQAFVNYFSNLKS